MSCMYTTQGDFICNKPIIEKFTDNKTSTIKTEPNVLINTLNNGDKYMVFNYTNNSDGLTGQTEYTFIVNDNVLTDASMLIVAGGGGGGTAIYCGGGGGGGGDVYEGTNMTIPVGKHTIRVGKGGNGGVINENMTSGSPGYNSSFIFESGFMYEFCGGGGGGSNVSSSTPPQTNKNSSGAGGGSANVDDISGNGNGKSGNGCIFNSSNATAGGGGGSNGNSEYISYNENNFISDGGKGTPSNITGNNKNYGVGGGGGCMINKEIPGSGISEFIDSKIVLSGTGGEGLDNVSAKDGKNGFGNGGGGGGHNSNDISDTSIIFNNRKGGNGGHGVVIIKCNTMI